MQIYFYPIINVEKLKIYYMLLHLSGHLVVSIIAVFVFVSCNKLVYLHSVCHIYTYLFIFIISFSFLI